jgi:hypothetical protein
MSGNLTPCIECGSMISSSAEQCPKCRVTEPHGVRCLVCSKQLKRKDATCLSNDWHTYHIDCINMVLSIPKGLSCPDCGVSLAFLSPLVIAKDRLPPCPQCGTTKILGRSFYTKCAVCYLPIYGEMSKEIRSGLYSDDYKYYHEVCAKTPYVSEKIRQDAKTLGIDRKSGCLGSLLLILGILTVIFGGNV